MHSAVRVSDKYLLHGALESTPAKQLLMREVSSMFLNHKAHFSYVFFSVFSNEQETSSSLYYEGEAI